jgi:hypothetical protein
VLRGRVIAPKMSGLRLLRLGTVPRVALIMFTTWRPGIIAHGVRGERLWNYVVPDAIDDVWVSDVDGDKMDDVAVGYISGVHVLDGNGRLRWKSTSIGNVWKVAAGDVLGVGTSQAVTTAGGKILIFNGADGTGHQEVASPPLAATVVRVRKLRDDEAATIFAAGHNGNTGASTAMALSGTGASKWRCCSSRPARHSTRFVST